MVGCSVVSCYTWWTFPSASQSDHLYSDVAFTFQSSQWLLRRHCQREYSIWANMCRFWAFLEEGNFDSLLACYQQPFVKISSCYSGSVSCRKWFISSLDHERGRSRCEIWGLCLSASPWGNKANWVPVKTLGDAIKARFFWSLLIQRDPITWSSIVIQHTA